VRHLSQSDLSLWTVDAEGTKSSVAGRAEQSADVALYVVVVDVKVGRWDVSSADRAAGVTFDDHRCPLFDGESVRRSMSATMSGRVANQPR